mmetsp:Transcript_18345/g.33718  ORF Transcript_18345/g.33718 Transcript_18345/m.33718 type:complete len:275 (-) Transcript_18345:568-1392(-)
MGNFLNHFACLGYHRFHLLFNILGYRCRHLCNGLCDLNHWNFYCALHIQSNRHIYNPFLSLQNVLGNFLVDILHHGLWRLRDGFNCKHLRHLNRTLLVDNLGNFHYLLDILNNLLGHALVNVLNSWLVDLLNHLFDLNLRNLDHSLFVNDLGHLHDLLDVLVGWHNHLLLHNLDCGNRHLLHNFTHLNLWNLHDHFFVLDLGYFNRSHLHLHHRLLNLLVNHLQLGRRHLFHQLLHCDLWDFHDLLRSHDHWHVDGPLDGLVGGFGHCLLDRAS